VNDRVSRVLEVGTRVLSAEEKGDPMKYYHTCNQDIVCEGFRIDMVSSYMAATKKKGDVTNGDKIFCYNKMKKINDAVLFGARTVKQVLSSSCYSEMDSFIASFKKEIADACCHGNVDEKKADPISFSLFQMILVWAIERANIFAWVWTILLWNHMARSISIDLLALHNTLISEDHFVICHDLTK
jgi:hypothetical protein